MPGPEPNTVWVEEYEGRFLSTFIPYCSWPPGNPGPQIRNRRNRAITIGRRVARGLWKCRWCGEELSFDKRSDTQFCGESCRKKAARERREARCAEPRNSAAAWR
jgi:hypothetical protein